jgi:dephospho-CoA kinase
MYVLGITGLYCSGKSIAGRYFAENGFIEIDVDKLGHLALIHKKTEIIRFFGNKIIENGDISRKKLGKIVFNSEKKLNELEKIVHPFMISMIKDQLNELKNENTQYVIINAAILYKMGLDKLCNAVLAIVSPEKIIIERGKNRDGLSSLEIKRRLKKQKIYNENFTSAEYFIENIDNYEKFMCDLKHLLLKIKKIGV